MRIFQNRRDTIDVDERESSTMLIGKRTANESDYLKNKQSIGEMVRKLNCSASKNHDSDFDRYLAGRDEIKYFGEGGFAMNHNSRRKLVPATLKTDGSSDITRPVLITVKNGSAKEQIPLSDNNNNNSYRETELKSSFVIGQLPKPSRMCTSASFRLGMSARKRHLNANKYFKHISAKDNDRSWSGGVRSKNHAVHEGQDIDKKRVAQESARRERWKRGLEMENRLFKNARTMTGRDKSRDDSSADSLTIGSQTTGTSITDYDSSSVDDWTDASQESNLVPKHHRRYHQNYSDGTCTNGQQVVESVAEDFGILAQLLLSDGYACFGTAADITKETVGGCKGERI